MGCDFFWACTVPRQETQERFVRFLGGYFDAGRIVRPEPTRRVRALVERERRSQPQVESSYPFDFFGLIPFDRYPDFCDRAQFVFDRSNSGRIVTLVPVAPEVDENHGAELEVRAVGYDRCLGDQVAFALLLNILRLRYCDDLWAADDYYVMETVGRDIQRWGLADALRDEARDWHACAERYFTLWDEHHPSPPPEPEPPPSAPRHPQLSPRDVPAGVDDLRVESLNLSQRTRNCLDSMGIETVRALLQWFPSDLLRTKNLGRKALKELREVLAARGLRFRDEG